MTNSAAVDRISMTLRPAIERFATAARAGCPRARVHANTGRSESFPFYATVALSEADPAGDEVVVLSIDVWTDGVAIKLSCDLADGDGRELANGPACSMLAPLGDSQDLTGWLRDAVLFVDGCTAEAVRVASARGL
ncbi:MAG: hypothetical protein RIT28_3528 [Pseudomonadota bacterium]|jgi:hypothetical protein